MDAPRNVSRASIPVTKDRDREKASSSSTSSYDRKYRDRIQQQQCESQDYYKRTQQTCGQTTPSAPTSRQPMIPRMDVPPPSFSAHHVNPNANPPTGVTFLPNTNQSASNTARTSWNQPLLQTPQQYENAMMQNSGIYNCVPSYNCAIPPPGPPGQPVQSNQQLMVPRPPSTLLDYSYNANNSDAGQYHQQQRMLQPDYVEFKGESQRQRDEHNISQGLSTVMFYPFTPITCAYSGLTNTNRRMVVTMMRSFFASYMPTLESTSISVLLVVNYDKALSVEITQKHFPDFVCKLVPRLLENKTLPFLLEIKDVPQSWIAQNKKIFQVTFSTIHHVTCKMGEAFRDRDFHSESDPSKFVEPINVYLTIRRGYLMLKFEHSRESVIPESAAIPECASLPPSRPCSVRPPSSISSRPPSVRPSSVRSVGPRSQPQPPPHQQPQPHLPPPQSTCPIRQPLPQRKSHQTTQTNGLVLPQQFFELHCKEMNRVGSMNEEMQTLTHLQNEQLQRIGQLQYAQMQHFNQITQQVRQTVHLSEEVHNVANRELTPAEAKRKRHLYTTNTQGVQTDDFETDFKIVPWPSVDGLLNGVEETIKNLVNHSVETVNDLQAKIKQQMIKEEKTNLEMSQLRREKERLERTLNYVRKKAEERRNNELKEKEKRDNNGDPRKDPTRTDHASSQRDRSRRSSSRNYERSEHSSRGNNRHRDSDSRKTDNRSSGRDYRSNRSRDRSRSKVRKTASSEAPKTNPSSTTTKKDCEGKKGAISNPQTIIIDVDEEKSTPSSVSVSKMKRPEVQKQSWTMQSTDAKTPVIKTNDFFQKCRGILSDLDQNLPRPPQPPPECEQPIEIVNISLTEEDIPALENFLRFSDDDFLKFLQTNNDQNTNKTKMSLPSSNMPKETTISEEVGHDLDFLMEDFL